MPALRYAPLALILLAAAAPARAADAATVVVQPAPAAPVAPAAAEVDVVPHEHAHAGTVIYVYPTSPSTFVPVVGLPSFLVQPGAPLPEVATHVVHAVPLPAYAAAGPAGDLDCSNFVGSVQVVPPDVYGLDDDGDGIGCEPGER